MTHFNPEQSDDLTTPKMLRVPEVQRPGGGFGLYVHIPFCHFLCHYCDFAKTANHDSLLVQDYFTALKRQFQELMEWLRRQPAGQQQFSSVFFGGGTPGLFTGEYAGLMELIYPHLDAGAEVSIECNPANVTRGNLREWRLLGFNRISIGVQSFDDQGLRVLTRDHDAATARQAIDLALDVIPNVNVDLIYGWQGQSEESWRQDLKTLVASGAPHASLYNLTYEARTPFGRMVSRGRLNQASDDSLFTCYESAREIFAAAGFIHDEVSNWALPGYTCRHNWLYWDFRYFAAIGAGAHGFLPDYSGQSTRRQTGELDPGFRYSFPREVRSFLRRAASSSIGFAADGVEFLGADWVEFPGQGRDLNTALTEYVGGALRTRHGVDLTFASALTEVSQGLHFEPRPALSAALDAGLARMETGGNRKRLVFDPREWFRETTWGVELLMSLISPEK